MTDIWKFVLAVIGSSAFFSFLQFIITRQDNKKGMEKQISEVKETIEENNKALNEKIDCNKAELCRTHILRFADEQRSGVVLHSDEYFRQQLLDIDTYNRYCETHPEFANGLTRMASEYIREEYRRIYLNNEN